MANVPPNDPNVNAPAIVPAPEEDPEEDPEEEPEDDDDDMDMDDEAEVIDPYMDDGSNNPPPPNSEDEETPPTSPVIHDADGQSIPLIASFGQNFHFGESSSTANLLTGNSKIVPTGPMCLNLGTAWKRLGKMEKLMSERINTEWRIKKKFKEQDRHFLCFGCDNIKTDRTVRNVMSDLSGVKKLVKGLSDRFDEYERSKFFDAKRVLEKELVNERNAKEFYRELVREPHAEPSARLVPASYPDDPYVVTRDAAIAAAAIATSGIDEGDDDGGIFSSCRDPKDGIDIVSWDGAHGTKEVIDPYMDDGSNNKPPPNSKDEETPLTSPVIPDANGQYIPPIASFGQIFHFGKSSSTANLLTRNSKIVLTGPMCPNLGTVWKRLGKMEKFMSERIDTEGRIKKKFKEQDRHILGLGCDNIETDRTVRNVMSDLSGVKKLVKGLSDRFDEYEKSKVFDAKRVLEKELVNERNAKEFYREFGEYMCQMLQNRQKSKGIFPLPLSSQVREPPAEPSARPVPALYPDDPYVVTRDAAIADATIATSCIDDDDDDTAPMDSQPHEPRGSPRDTR
nr:hypothetical protein [Tanacetum cinerariifolium]